ncbi:MAG TPA: hypothetical protein VNN76_09535 [Bacteroidota bacterium]|nr:hypothetical protein [Bacteroidota bacterium]
MLILIFSIQDDKFTFMFFRLITLALLGFALIAPAQAQYHSSYAATELAFTEISRQSRIFLGARGGWRFRNDVSIGGNLYTLLSTSPLSGSFSSRADSFQVMYGGPTIGYTILRTQGFEVSVNVLFGLGGLGLRYRDPQVEARRYDMFVTVQPEVLLLANVSSSFRLFAAGSYRYVTGVNTIGYSDEFLSEAGAAVGFLFSL